MLFSPSLEHDAVDLVRSTVRAEHDSFPLPPELTSDLELLLIESLHDHITQDDYILTPTQERQLKADINTVYRNIESALPSPPEPLCPTVIAQALLGPLDAVDQELFDVAKGWRWYEGHLELPHLKEKFSELWLAHDAVDLVRSTVKDEYTPSSLPPELNSDLERLLIESLRDHITQDDCLLTCTQKRQLQSDLSTVDINIESLLVYGYPTMELRAISLPSLPEQLYPLVIAQAFLGPVDAVDQELFDVAKGWRWYQDHLNLSQLREGFRALRQEGQSAYQDFIPLLANDIVDWLEREGVDLDQINDDLEETHPSLKLICDTYSSSDLYQPLNVMLSVYNASDRQRFIECMTDPLHHLVSQLYVDERYDEELYTPIIRSLIFFYNELFELDTSPLLALIKNYGQEQVSRELSMFLRGCVDPEMRYLTSEIILFLVQQEVVKPIELISVDALISSKRQVPGEMWNMNQLTSDPRYLEYWLKLDPSLTCLEITEIAQDLPIDTLASFASGVRRALMLEYGESDDYRHQLNRYASVMYKRWSSAESHISSYDELTTELWLLARHTLRTDRCDLTERWRGPLKEFTLKRLGMLRVELQAHPDDGVRFEARAPYIRAACFYLLALQESTLWNVLRRLLLCFMSLRHAAVPPDLRTWDQRGEEPLPAYWGWLPKLINLILYTYLTQEMTVDPELKKLRKEFAEFLLKRLKGDSGTQQMVEPISVWREACAHALIHLRVNPGGKAHRLLNWSSHHDPSLEVRSVAREAYTKVRKNHGLRVGSKPRRPVFEAFWFLRQAHLRSLNAEINEHLAQRTYREEVRRNYREEV